MWNQVRETWEQTPDSIKVGVVSAPPATTYFLGLQLLDWTYVFSIIVAILVIIEKIPKVVSVVKMLYRKLRNK